MQVNQLNNKLEGINRQHQSEIQTLNHKHASDINSVKLDYENKLTILK